MLQVDRKYFVLTKVADRSYTQFVYIIWLRFARKGMVINMVLCPSCGCRISGASRFCPMCGVTLKENAVNARFGEPGEAAEVCMPQANENLLDQFEGVNRCGVGVIRLMRVLAALAAVVIALGGIIGGIMLLVSGNNVPGILLLVLGPVAALFLFMLMTIGIVQYENISLIARNTESQNFIGAAQLELLCGLARSQNESLELSRQTIELLRAMDEDIFDISKQTERHTELLEKLTESQRLSEQRLADIKYAGEQLSRTASAHVQSARSWRSNTRQFAHAIALSVSQLPERLRRMLAGETDAADDAPDGQADEMQFEEFAEDMLPETAEPEEISQEESDS